MAIQYVNIGINPNDGTGDDLRTAFLKVNDNFQFLGSIGLTDVITNGANVGGGSGQLFAGKSLETLNFRSIAAGNGISITTDQNNNVITVSNSVTATASITKIFDDNNTYYEATTPGASLKILGAPNSAISTQIVGNEVIINGVFSLSDDLAPILSGSLDLNSRNIVGEGNINITGSATVDTLTVGRVVTPGIFPGSAVINGTLTVNDDATLNAVIADTVNAGTSIISPTITATSSFLGTLNGNTIGSHYGNVAVRFPGQIGQNGLPVPDLAVVNIAGVSYDNNINAVTGSATFTGNLFGDVSGGFTGNLIAGGVAVNGQTISGTGRILIDGVNSQNQNPLIVNSSYYTNPILSEDVPTVDFGGGVPIFTMRQQAFTDSMSESLKLRSISFNSNQVMPLGTTIAFESQNIIDEDGAGYDPLNPPTAPAFVQHGYVGILNFKEFDLSTAPEALDTSYSSFVVRVRNKTDGDPITAITSDTAYLRDAIIARGDGRVTVSLIEFNKTTIKPTKLLNIDTNLPEEAYWDLILKTEVNDRYINFYGDYDESLFLQPGRKLGRALGGYSFPRTIGTPGQVLRVRVPDGVNPNNLLEWANAGSGGGSISAIDSIVLGATTQINTVAAHGLVNKQEITVTDITGTIELNGNTYYVDVLDSNSFVLYTDNNLTTPVDSTAYTAYISGGFVSGAMSGGVTGFLNLSDVPASYLPGDAGKIVVVNSTVNGLAFSDSINATVTGDLIGNASTATALETAREINGIPFDGTTDIDLTTDDIAEGANLYFTETLARSSISVTAGKALSYDALTGELDLAESVSNTADTLVKRDALGDTVLGKLKVTTLEKNSADTVITFASPIETTEQINSTASIITSGTVSAGFISLTGTGDQTISSTGKIVLSPTTSVDINAKKITNLSLTAPTDDSDAATKKYVDDTTDSVFNSSLQSLTVAGDSGGTLDVTKGNTFEIDGSTNIETSTTATGVQVSLKPTISGVNVSGNISVSGQLTGNSLRGGNIAVSGNAITQQQTATDITVVPGTGGGAVVISGGDLRLVNSRLSIASFDVLEFPANTVEKQILLTSPTTFIRTLNWVDTNANLAFAELPNGSTGQIKTIIMQDRGTYGDALDTRPRYLVLRGNINGTSRTVNIAQNDPNGSTTFIFLNNYWWRMSHVA